MKKVLAIMAHPDDAEIRCFGTLMKLKKQGKIVRIIVATKGENGKSLDNSRVEENLSSKREKESMNAFVDAGIEVSFLNFPDGNITFCRDSIVTLEKYINDFKPEIVITHFVDNYGVDHQDHSNLGKCAINVASRKSFVKQVLLAEPTLTFKAGFQPNFFVDITDFFNQKVQALTKHETQDGREYLTKQFHENRSAYYSNNVAYRQSSDSKNKYTEAFFCLFNCI